MFPLLCVHLVALQQVFGSAPSMSYYFPEVEHDLTKVTWEHAVNSREKLDRALAGEALMLEADVVSGHTSVESRDLKEPKVAVMAHPPETISNFTLQEFLQVFDGAVRVNKGIKLDFKSRDALSNSVNLVDNIFTSERDYPVWLNADIMAGPVNGSSAVVDADYFLTTCISRYPSATISVGWSTYLEPGSTQGAYTQADLDKMTDALNRNMVITSPVTFAVRAALAARSVDLLANLIETSSASTTLTIWSSVDTDVIDVHGLKKLIQKVGKSKVYLDLPADVSDNVQKSQGSSGSPHNSLPNIATLSALVASLLLFL